MPLEQPKKWQKDKRKENDMDWIFRKFMMVVVYHHMKTKKERGKVIIYKRNIGKFNPPVITFFFNDLKPILLIMCLSWVMSACHSMQCPYIFCVIF